MSFSKFFALGLLLSTFGCAVGSEDVVDTNPTTNDQALDQGENVVIAKEAKVDRSLTDIRTPQIGHDVLVDARTGHRPYLPASTLNGKLHWSPEFGDETSVGLKPPTDP